MTMTRTLFRNAELLDTEAGELRPGVAVLVEGDRIRAVIDAGGKLPAAEHTIDVRGRTLMPGLIDAHVHVTIVSLDLAAMAHTPTTLIALQAGRIMEEMLLRGFTTVRDAGGADWGIAQAVERGLVKGPRLFHSGRTLSQTGGHGDFRPRSDFQQLCACEIYSSGFAHVADGVPAVRKAAREELRRGARQVKIMASGGVASPTDPVWNVQYSADEMRAIVEEAQGWRTYAMAHAYTPEAISRAVAAGVRTIEHGNLIDGASARLMAEAGAFLVPTLVTYHALDEMGRALGFPEVSQRKIHDVLDAGLASLETARHAGVQIGFGTDLLGETHSQQNRELTIRAEVQSPAEILRAATRVNAAILGQPEELGIVQPNAYADLLLVDGDPLADISLLARPQECIDVIMARGDIVKHDN